MTGDMSLSFDGPAVRIGRVPESDVQLLSCCASRHHAVLQQGGRGWELVDMGSTNGTWLNGVRVAPMLGFPVKKGDCIVVPGLEMRVEEE